MTKLRADQIRDSVLLSDFQRNAVINGNFDIWERNESKTNPSHTEFVADRWQVLLVNSGTLPTSIIHSQSKLADGGEAGLNNLYKISVNGAGSGFGATDYYIPIRQKIENGTRLLCGDGKKVTISFYAKSTIANKKIGLFAQQQYGSGGAATENLQGEVFTLTSTLTRYSVTFDTNTLSGKTVNADSFVPLFTIMWGSTNGSSWFGDATAEDFGGSGDIYIGGVMVSAGEDLLDFRPKSPLQERLDCLRYAYVIKTESANGIVANGAAVNSTHAYIDLNLPIPMRVAPSLEATASDWKLYDGGSINLTAISLLSTFQEKGNIIIDAQVASGLTQYRPYKLIGDGTTGRKIILSAEL